MGVGLILFFVRFIMVLEGFIRLTYGSFYSVLVECVNVAELLNGLIVGVFFVIVYRSGLVFI